MQVISSGIEGAIHAMHSLFVANQNLSFGWEVLMVDACNAFNSLNQIAMLLHVGIVVLDFFLILIVAGQC